VPYDRGDIVAMIHERGRIVTSEYVESGTHLTAMVHPVDEAALRAFAVVPA